MKICHVLWGFAYGGIETMVVNIANVQAELGEDVRLMIINDLIDESLAKLLSPKIKLYFLRRKVGSKNLFSLLRLNSELIMMRNDVIHLHHVGIYDFLLPQLRKISCTTHHTVCLPNWKRNIVKIPRLFSISEYTREDIFSQTGKRSTLVRNGINASKFRRKSKEEVYDGKRKFKIVQIGRLEHNIKGQDILIKAASILKERMVDFKIDIIGKGPSMDYLSELIDKGNLIACVELVGAKSPENVWESLSSYDLLVQPSRFEGFGLTIAEGMAAKVPVLVSDIQVQLDVIDHGECGYFFKSEDAESCANAIGGIIEHYDFSIAERALERVTTMYDVSVTAKKYIEEYRKFFN